MKPIDKVIYGMVADHYYCGEKDQRWPVRRLIQFPVSRALGMPAVKTEVTYTVIEAQWTSLRKR